MEVTADYRCNRRRKIRVDLVYYISDVYPLARVIFTGAVLRVFNVFSMAFCFTMDFVKQNFNCKAHMRIFIYYISSPPEIISWLSLYWTQDFLVEKTWAFKLLRSPVKRMKWPRIVCFDSVCFMHVTENTHPKVSMI